MIMGKFKGLFAAFVLLFAVTLNAASLSGNLTTGGSKQGPLYLKSNERATYSLTFSEAEAVVILQRAAGGTNTGWVNVAETTDTDLSGTYHNTTGEPIYVRWVVADYTSGTIAATLADVDGDIIQDIHLNPYGTPVVQLNDQDEVIFSGGLAPGAFGDGSVSAPSISFQDDPDTGVYRSGDDTLSFATAGVLALEVDASQNISIPNGNLATTRSQDSGPVQMVVSNTSVTAPQAVIRMESQDEARLEFLDTTGERLVFEWKADVLLFGTTNNPENESFFKATDSTKTVLVGSNGWPNVDIGPSNRFRANATGLGFYNTTPAAQPTVTGSRGGNAALADLLTDLALLGLIVDSSS